MEELLRFILILAAIWLFIRRFRRPGTRGGVSRASPENRRPDSIPMLRCARCGVYVPHNDAVSAHGQAFCSRQHAAMGARQ